MDRSSATAKALVSAFRKRKILTLEQLLAAAGCHSRMTLWRHLKPLGYSTSFNHNSRYYTLAETACFDASGLWFHRDVGFSLHGSLRQTLVTLVHDSKAGMTANELSELLRTRVQNQLAQLIAKNELARIKRGRGHLYLSADVAVQAQQLKRREAGDEKGRPESESSQSDTIAILAQLVRAPRSSARHIATLLSGQGLSVTRSQVLEVIDRYQLRKKGRQRRSRF